MLKMGPIKFLYNSQFDFTAKSLVTNNVVIERPSIHEYVYCLAKIRVDPYLKYGSTRIFTSRPILLKYGSTRIGALDPLDTPYLA